MKKAKPLRLFLILAFSSTWLCWGLIAIFSQSSLFVILNTQMLVAATMWLPGLAALLVKWVYRKQQSIELGLKPKFKGCVGGWFAAWLGPLALTILGAAVYFLLVRGSFDPQMTGMQQVVALYAQGRGTATGWLVLGVNLLIGPFINVLFAAGEEIGWRGYLYPALAQRIRPGRAAILSGAIWGLWHAPIIAMGHNYGIGYFGWPVTGILAMIVFCIGFGCFFAWLRERTGSVWPAALAHGALNAFAALPIYLQAADHAASPLLGPAPVGLIAGIPTLLCGALCIKQIVAAHNSDTPASDPAPNGEV